MTNGKDTIHCREGTLKIKPSTFNEQFSIFLGRIRGKHKCCPIRSSTSADGAKKK